MQLTEELVPYTCFIVHTRDFSVEKEFCFMCRNFLKFLFLLYMATWSVI
jgi:hypothetical protein